MGQYTQQAAKRRSSMERMGVPYVDYAVEDMSGIGDRIQYLLSSATESSEAAKQVAPEVDEDHTEKVRSLLRSVQRQNGVGGRSTPECLRVTGSAR